MHMKYKWNANERCRRAPHRLLHNGLLCRGLCQRNTTKLRRNYPCEKITLPSCPRQQGYSPQIHRPSTTSTICAFKAITRTKETCGIEPQRRHQSIQVQQQVPQRRCALIYLDTQKPFECIKEEALQSDKHPPEVAPGFPIRRDVYISHLGMAVSANLSSV